MINLDIVKEKVLSGNNITREEALWLYDNADLEELCKAADSIRKQFCGDAFDICSIINGKSGKCSENCRFCAQSAHHNTHVKEYPLLPKEDILSLAKDNDSKGVMRYSIVTSGKKLTDDDIDRICDDVRDILKETGLSVCISLGTLNESQYARLKEAGVSRVHNNLETSRNNFPNICTTHSFEDKLSAIQAAKDAGLSVCSGGIMGLGESKEDRVDMALELRSMGIKSIPVNMLNPIPGTPLEDNKILGVDDMRRIVAVYRFILPDAFIRLAGGRGLLEDKGRSCFESGANAAITGDMLTTAGITIETDMKLIKELGYIVNKG